MFGACAVECFSVPILGHIRREFRFCDAMRGRAREGGDETDISRQMGARETVGEKRAQLRRVERGPWRQRDDCEDLLLADVRRDADRGAFLNGWVRGDRGFDLKRGDVLPPPPDRLFGAAEEPENAVFAAPREIAGVKPSVAKGLARRVRGVQIAGAQQSGRIAA